MKFLIVFASLFIAANGQIIMPGTCEDPKVIQNFDIPAYTGLWYEIYRFEHDNQRSGDCVTAKYTLNKDGIVEVHNAMVLNGTDFTIDGTVAPAADANGQSKLEVNFPFINRGASKYWVLATDYTSYSLVYSCTNLPKGQKRVSSWILSRSNELTPQGTEAINPIFEASKELSWDTYRKTSHSEESCRSNGVKIAQ